MPISVGSMDFQVLGLSPQSDFELQLGLTLELGNLIDYF
jgi:hypothetical protein